MPDRPPRPRHLSRVAVLALAARAAGGAAAVAAPATAAAQASAIEVRAGMASVVGRYREELDVGPMMGLSVRTRLGPRLGARADASVQTLRLLSSGEMQRYTLGLETPLVATAPDARMPLALTATLGGGAARLRFDETRQWRPTVAGGLRVTADVWRRVGLFADATATGTFLGDREALLRVPTDAGGTLVTVPLTLGAQLRF